MAKRKFVKPPEVDQAEADQKIAAQKGLAGKKRSAKDVRGAMYGGKE